MMADAAPSSRTRQRSNDGTKKEASRAEQRDRAVSSPPLVASPPEAPSSSARHSRSSALLTPGPRSFGGINPPSANGEPGSVLTHASITSRSPVTAALVEPQPPQPPCGSPSSFRGRTEHSGSSSILVTNGVGSNAGLKSANSTLKPSRAERLDGAALEAAAVRFPDGTRDQSCAGLTPSSPVFATNVPSAGGVYGIRRRFESSATSHSSVLSSPRTGPIAAHQRSSLRVHLSRRAFIGKGSFGVVYKAMDTDTNQLLAVKEVTLSGLTAATSGSPTGSGTSTLGTHSSANEKRIASVKKELAVLRQLNHPNIVQCLGEEIEDDCLRIYMEYVPGGSVSSLIKTFGAFQERQASAFTRQILCGLVYLHAKNIIHRDLKGDNLLVDANGGLKLADFGTARDVTSNVATTNAALAGTAYFTAPEVAVGSTVGAKADIWSTACCVIEMLTGAPPLAHIGNQFSIMMLLAQSDETLWEHYIPKDNDWSTSLLDFLAQCLQKDITKRPSAADLLKHPWIVRPPVADSVKTPLNEDVLTVTVASVALPEPIPGPHQRSASLEDSVLDVTDIGLDSLGVSRSPVEMTVAVPNNARDEPAASGQKEKRRKKNERGEKSEKNMKSEKREKRAKQKEREKAKLRRAKSVGASPTSLTGTLVTVLGSSQQSSVKTAASHLADSPLSHTTPHLRLSRDSTGNRGGGEGEAMSAGFLPPLSPSLRVGALPDVNLSREGSVPPDMASPHARRSPLDAAASRRESRQSKKRE